MLLSCVTTEGIAHKCVSVGWRMRLDDKHIHTDTDTVTQQWHQWRRQRRKCMLCAVWDTVHVHVHSIVYKVTVVQTYRRTPSNIVRAQYRSHWECLSIYLCISLWLLENCLGQCFIFWIYRKMFSTKCDFILLFELVASNEPCSMFTSYSMVVFVWALGINKRLLNGDNFQFRYLLWKSLAVVLYVCLCVPIDKRQIFYRTNPNILHVWSCVCGKLTSKRLSMACIMFLKLMENSIPSTRIASPQVLTKENHSRVKFVVRMKCINTFIISVVNKCI